MTTSDTAVGQRCAWCGGPLPALIEMLGVVHGADATLLMTCSTACLAELVDALAGRPADDRGRMTGRCT